MNIVKMEAGRLNDTCGNTVVKRLLACVAIIAVIGCARQELRSSPNEDWRCGVVVGHLIDAEFLLSLARMAERGDIVALESALRSAIAVQAEAAHIDRIINQCSDVLDEFDAADRQAFDSRVSNIMEQIKQFLSEKVE